jgi:outer membrane murein-binding lipoprotein Lpp
VAKSKEDKAVSELEALATKLDALAREATAMGEDRAAKSITNAAKSARWSDKQRAVRVKRVGSIVSAMQAKGLTPEQIVSRLTAGQG